ncbi:MAG TPA: very short patch repair endonuclease [Actinobacteria bacterium]|nr:very short patch repair endonuclease [Actinomycetota bacterium]
MKNTPTRDTPAELAVRKLLHARGLRYRVDSRPLPTLNRRADLVFPRQRVAVFIDGCFWHGCPQHGTGSKSNSDYWDAKISGNRVRDLDTNTRLEEQGWQVIRVWEHESATAAADLIAEAVRGRS